MRGKPGTAFLFLAAGCLRDDELQAASREQWRSFGASARDIDEGLSADERDLYCSFLRSGDRILVVGCGPGRDLIALVRMGYNASGLDQCQPLIHTAQMDLARLGIHAAVHVGDIRTAEVDGLYDVVIFSDGCYSFIHHRAARIATLRRIRTHLSPGGRMLFSYHPFVRQSAAGLWLTRLAARISRADWTPEPGDIFSRHRKPCDILRYRHDFTPSDFEGECAEAGLAVLDDKQGLGPLRTACAVVV